MLNNEGQASLKDVFMGLTKVLQGITLSNSRNGRYVEGKVDINKYTFHHGYSNFKWNRIIWRISEKKFLSKTISDR